MNTIAETSESNVERFANSIQLANEVHLDHYNSRLYLAALSTTNRSRPKAVQWIFRVRYKWDIIWSYLFVSGVR